MPLDLKPAILTRVSHGPCRLRDAPAQSRLMTAITPPPLRHALADLSPANFGMVMATGIVSLTADMLGWPLLAQVLLDAGLGLRVARLAWVFGLLETAEQAVDQGLFFSVHQATSWAELDSGQAQRWGARPGDSIARAMKLFSASGRSGLKLRPAFSAMRC